MTAAHVARRTLLDPTERLPEPPFTDEHEDLRAAIRRFVQRELHPRVAEWERAEWFPNDIFRRLAELGWLGLKYPVWLGGKGGDFIHDAVLMEEFARCRSGGLTAGISAHIGIATPPLFRFGTTPQKHRWLEPAIRGELIGALAITEPDAGSDVAAIKTSAERVAGGWLINGTKTFITNGVRAGFYVLAARTRRKERHHGLSLFILGRGEGVQASAIAKLGWHASDTAHIFITNAFVPDEDLLGEEGRGFSMMMVNFQWERLVMSLNAVGAMRETLERTITFANTRCAFGRTIASHQAIRHALAEMSVAVEASAAATYRALRHFVTRSDATEAVSMAKLVTQRANFDLQDRCLQIHGGAGYMVEHEIERATRDARLGPIGGGSDQIMREILARRIIGPRGDALRFGTLPE